MIVKTIPVGQLEANCHILIDERTNKALVIDPGDDPDTIMEALKGFQVEQIVLTHGHFDHIGAAVDIKEATGASISIHEADLPVYESASEHAALWGFAVEPLPDPDFVLADGDEFAVGSMALMVLHTPGHSPGSICIYGEGVVVTGDTLFAGSVGRTDFPGGSTEELGASFRKLMRLPKETQVLPGHGPASTIGRELRFNMFAYQFMGEGMD